MSQPFDIDRHVIFEQHTDKIYKAILVNLERIAKLAQMISRMKCHLTSLGRGYYHWSWCGLSDSLGENKNSAIVIN